MEDLLLHTGAPKVHLEDNTSCIPVVEAKRVTPRVKYIDITVCFLQDKFENDIFLPKYDKSSVIPANMCTKTCSGPIISRITNWMNGLRLYPTSET